MINSILNGLLNFIIGFIGLILSPIDNFITTNLPSFNDILLSFSGFIDSVLGFFPWILSWFHIPGTLLLFVTGYFAFKISASAAIHIIKIALAWYRKLMP